jgi:TPR repeat protein
MNISGFTTQSLEAVENLLYAEGQRNPFEGQCGQKKLREQAKQPRTPAQEQADRNRAQAQRGRSNVSSAVRSEGAKKAAETRKKCKGGGSTTGPTTT